MSKLERTTPALIATAPFTSTELTGLASGAYLLGANIITPPADATMLDFRLVLPSSITPAAGGSLALFFLPEIDGTNFPSPPGASSAAPPMQYYAGTYDLIGSALTVADMQNLRCPDYPFKALLYNNGSVAFPSSGTFTASLYGKTYQWV